MTMTWASTSPRSASARLACSADAAPKNSWLISAPSGAASTCSRSRAHAPAARGLRRSRPGRSRTTRVDHMCSRRRYAGIDDALLRREPDGSPRARSGRRSCRSWGGRRAGRRGWPSRHRRALVTLDQLVHLGLVTLGDGQQELGHQVGQLGQPEVECPALLDLLLEAVDPVAQIEDGHVGELLADGAAAASEGRLQRSHDTTIRQILEGTTSAPRPLTGPEASRMLRSRIVAPARSSSAAIRSGRRGRRWWRAAYAVVALAGQELQVELASVAQQHAGEPVEVHARRAAPGCRRGGGRARSAARVRGRAAPRSTAPSASPAG